MNFFRKSFFVFQLLIVIFITFFHSILFDVSSEYLNQTVITLPTEYNETNYIDENLKRWENYMTINGTNIYWWKYIYSQKNQTFPIHIPKARSICPKGINNKWIVTTFASGEHRLKQVKKLEETAISIGGADEFWLYRSKDLDSDWLEMNKHIMEHKDGMGCWAWKSFIIWKALLKMNEGDILFWIDSDTYFLRNASEYFCLVQDLDILVFHLSPPSPGKVWTDHQAFFLTNTDSPQFTETRLILGGYFMIKKTDRMMRLIAEWMVYSQDERIICALANIMPNYEEFYRHRYDQSILSIISKKFKLFSLPTPAQWAISEEDKILRKLSGIENDLLYHQ